MRHSANDPKSGTPRLGRWVGEGVDLVDEICYSTTYQGQSLVLTRASTRTFCDKTIPDSKRGQFSPCLIHRITNVAFFHGNC
jgi:hypothetical protein